MVASPRTEALHGTPLAMSPRLPTELVVRIIRTAQYLERVDRLHGSKMWQSVRWYTENKDITEVPVEWADNTWFLPLVRAVFDPSVRTVHLKTAVAG